MPPLISIENLNFKYPDLAEDTPNTLQKINLEIASGEYIAILGANGSGKSTLARMINALLLPDSGSVRIDGMDTRDPKHLADVRKKIGMVFQFPEEQIFSSTIEEDVAFGLENYAIPYEEMHERVREVLTQFNLWDIREKPSYLLSAGQTQRLALAGVLVIRPGCVIFDEATAMLDPIGRRVTLSQMQQLHENGNTVLHITHSMDEAIQAERIVVLNQGKVVYDGPAEELFKGNYDLRLWRLEYPRIRGLIEELISAGIQVNRNNHSLNDLAEDISGKYEHVKLAAKQDDQVKPPDDENEIEVHQLRHIYLEGTPYQSRAILDASMNVAKGSCMGLIGVTGSGKSTLLQHLNGILRPQFGSIRVGKYDLGDPKVNIHELVQYVGLVMQNPEAQFFEEFAGDEIAYGPRTIGMEGSLSERVAWAMDLVGLDFKSYKDRRVNTLSGGEKRKVALASILVLRPTVLLMDEPTAGLDPGSHHEIMSVFETLLKDGTTMVISSHNMEDITRLSSAITWMEKGISVMCDRAGIVMRSIAENDTVTMLPSFCAQLSILLEQKGFDFVELPVSVDDLCAVLMRKDQA